LSYWTGCKGKVLFIALFHLWWCTSAALLSGSFHTGSIARPVCGGWQYHQPASQGLAPLYVWTTTAFGLFLFLAFFWNSWAETTGSGRNIKEDVYSLVCMYIRYCMDQLYSAGRSRDEFIAAHHQHQLLFLCFFIFSQKKQQKNDQILTSPLSTFRQISIV
jgi:hypothetical protein